MPFSLRAGIGLRVVAFLCACLVLGAAVGLWAMKQYQNVATEMSMDMARRTSDLAEALKTQVIRNAYSTLHAMSGFQRVNGLDPKDCSDVASFFLQSSTGYANIGSILPNGEVYCAAIGTKSVRNVAKESWFKEAMGTGQFTMSDHLISPVTHNSVVAFALPLKTAKGEITQVLVSTLETDYIEKVVDLPNLPADSSIMVIDKSGNNLAGESDKAVKPGQNIASWEVAKRVLTADKPFVMNSTELDGTKRVFAATSSRVSEEAVPGAGNVTIRSLSILVGIPARRITAAVMAPLQASGIAVGIVFAIFLAGTYFFIRRMLVQPILAIQTAADKLASGDLTARVASKRRTDEIGALAHAFDAMASSLGNRDAELRRSNERVQRILDTEPACVLIANEAIDIVDINQAGIELFGAKKKEDLIGTSFFRFLAPDELERFQAHLEVIRTGKTDSILVQIVNLLGEHRWIESHAAEINFDDGNGRTGIAIIRDKTDELATSAQLVQAQKMESIGRLTGGVAHDFNNLLTIMMGNAEILSERLENNPELANLSRMIESAAQRGAELTHRMLAFARRQVLRPSELDVNALLTRMVDMMSRILGEDIQVRVDNAKNLWCVAADSAQMESAILNLAINARDAMPQGGTLTIETENTRLDADYASRNPDAAVGDYVVIAISDSGIGMSSEILNRAFDPFFTTKEVGKGSGLGLSMVYGFVKQSQGHIKIYSERAHGTTVRIYLPKSNEDTLSQDVAEEMSIEEASGSETILVVEDEDAVRIYVTQQLTGLGYTVIETTDAHAALEILESDQHIDLLFTDIVLPRGMNGRQLAEIGQRTRPALKVLFTTGYTENAVVHHGKLDAGVELLSKPYRRADLARHVRKVLDKT
ncbi:MAG: response regulator [Parvibaculum sp.]|uniref:ATP-binding protein n=1 Tax=Parvibaculum sp. TaxID=2024848 RepID=UPI0025CE6088|nr:ATP-binding protein [Parvibaculum sp.]MCE9649147.1 response regulator [Parvibaculum sp.]